jgi:hypothetical protein
MLGLFVIAQQPLIVQGQKTLFEAPAQGKSDTICDCMSFNDQICRDCFDQVTKCNENCSSKCCQMNTFGPADGKEKGDKKKEPEKNVKGDTKKNDGKGMGDKNKPGPKPPVSDAMSHKYKGNKGDTKKPKKPTPHQENSMSHRYQGKPNKPKKHKSESMSMSTRYKGKGGGRRHPNVRKHYSASMSYSMSNSMRYHGRRKHNGRSSHINIVIDETTTNFDFAAPDYEHQDTLYDTAPHHGGRRGRVLRWKLKEETPKRLRLS